MTDIADQEPLPSEDTTPEDQHDPHQFDDAPDSKSDPILDYINSQHHQEEGMSLCCQDISNLRRYTPSVHQLGPSTRSIFISFIMLLKQNKPIMVHLLIGEPMVDLQGQMSESSPNPPGNALLLVLINTRSMAWILYNVLHWSTPTMGMSTSS